MSAFGIMAMAIVGVGIIAGTAFVSRCPRLAVEGGLTAAVYLGGKSNQEFFSAAVWALVIGGLFFAMVRVGKEVFG